MSLNRWHQDPSSQILQLQLSDTNRFIYGR